MIAVDASFKAAVFAGKEVAICFTIVLLKSVLVGESINVGVAHRLAFFVQDATGCTAILTALEVAVFGFPFVPDYHLSTFMSEKDRQSPANLL